MHDQGGLFSMLYGRGGTDFFGSRSRSSRGPPAGYQVEVALHEVSHTLGRVQMSSPNSSGAGHCNDQYDLMCYEDGGPGSLFVDPNCDGAAAPADPYSEEFQAWTATRTTSSTPPRPGGSYLATTGTWPGRCSSARSGLHPARPAAPDTKITKEPSSKTSKRKVKIVGVAEREADFPASSMGTGIDPSLEPNSQRPGTPCWVRNGFGSKPDGPWLASCCDSSARWLSSVTSASPVNSL